LLLLFTVFAANIAANYVVTELISGELSAIVHDGILALSSGVLLGIAQVRAQ
jgi:hypothetical protein